MYAQGVIFDPSNAASTDGSTATVNLGRANELLMAELHGKYFTQCYRGNVYLASTTTAGVVIPIASTLTPTYSIWNPAGSGKLCVPIVTLIGWTATTAALGSFVWHVTTNAGAAIATGGAISAFASVAAVNANVGSGKVSAMRIGATGTNTLAAAASMYRETGCMIIATTAATAAAPGWVWRDEWDGTGILPPGNAMHLLGTTAIAVGVTVSTVYVELPL